MSQRKKIVIAISVILGILVIVLLVWSIGKRQPGIEDISQTNEGLINSINTVAGIASLANIAIEPPVVTQEPTTQTNLIVLAMTVAEKFGTFSTESNFENIKDLQKLMTPEMAAWSEKYMAENKLNPSEFYGITTKALNAKIITLDDEETKAQLLVDTQRSETKGAATTPRIFYQKLLVNLIKSGESWRIDKVSWE